MYTCKINAILKELGWDKPGDEFAPVYFSKKGSLNLSRIYFIVTDETASASELLINTLSPYMQVYMVGNYHSDGKTNTANNTYGKPVGFFPVEIVSSSNELYVTSFQMFNKNGVGDYFNGLKPNSHVWEYDSFLDFGNQDETMLAAALAHIKTGIFKSTQPRSVSEKTNFERKFSQEGASPRKIQGMYKFRTKKIHF
jgi:carboxyl-terminal processing protease